VLVGVQIYFRLRPKKSRDIVVPKVVGN
jgi:hypothetical protein